MLIQELTKQASLDVLAGTHFGRLACARGMQPYIIPFHFAYQNYCLYSFSMPGQKIDWMRANPLVCVEADQMRREEWTTVVVFGLYQELPDTTEMQSERALAVELLQQRAQWWEPGYTTIFRDGTLAAPVPIFYRINVVQITGRRGTSEPRPPDTSGFTADSLKKVGCTKFYGESGGLKQSFFQRTGGKKLM